LLKTLQKNFELLPSNNLEVKLVTLAVIKTVLKKEDGKNMAQDTAIYGVLCHNKIQSGLPVGYPTKASRNHPDIKNRV